MNRGLKQLFFRLSAPCRTKIEILPYQLQQSDMKKIHSTTSHAYLQLHMHTAGQPLSGCAFYRVSAETESMALVLHGLDKLALPSIKSQEQKEDITTKAVNSTCPTNRAR